MKTLGTILPTAASLKADDQFASREKARKAKIAATTPELENCERRVVGGEVRYYDTTDQYAIVARSGAVIWFAVTPDGDYRI